MSRSLTFLTILFCTQFGSSLEERCPPGYEKANTEYTMDPSTCYKYVFNPEESERWIDADRKCKQDGAKLIIIENEAEARWIIEWTLERNNTFCNKLFVNAHSSLYAEGPAWFGGNIIKLGFGEAIREIIRTSAKSVCPEMPISFNRECFVMNANRTLIDIDCSENITNVGFVCKYSNTLSRTGLSNLYRPRSLKWGSRNSQRAQLEIKIVSNLYY